MNKNNSYRLLLAFLCLCQNNLFSKEDEESLSDDLEVVFVPQEKIKNHNLNATLNKHSIFYIPLIASANNKVTSRQLGFNKNDFGGYLYGLSEEKLGISNPINSFLFSAKNLDYLASSTYLDLTDRLHKEFNTYFGYGLYNTLRAASSLNIPIDAYSSLFLATSIDSYQGNFKYEDYQLNKPVAMSRKNNDQHIFKVIARYNRETAEEKLLASFMSNIHEGGVEGYTYNPLSLRAFNINTGVNSEFEKIIKDTRLKITTSHVFFEQYTSQNLNKNSDFMQTSHDLIAKFQPLKFPSFLAMEFGQKILFEREYINSINRFGLGFLMERNMQFFSPLNPNLHAKFDMTAYHNEDILFNKQVSFSIEPTHFINTSINYIKIGRVPSLLEMYGNNAFFVANKNLESESIYQISLNNHVKAHKMINIDANLFFDIIKNSIVYQPYKAKQLIAINSAKAKKIGAEIGFNFMPLSFMTLSTSNEINFYNKVEKTHKPLPQSSFLKGIGKLIIGKEDFLSATLQTRYQTQSFFYFEERLRMKPYMLVDLLASYKINKNISLSASVENIFNEKGAKNSLYMPIAPLSFFAQINVNMF